MSKPKDLTINSKIKILQDGNKSAYNSFQNKSKTNNFQEFQKVYRSVFNKQFKKELSVNKSIPQKSRFSSNSEIKMIKIEVPNLGSEHAILHLNPSKFSEKNIIPGTKNKRKMIKPESNIKLLIEEAKDTSRKLKQIQIMLQDRRKQIKLTGSTNKIKQNDFEQIRKNYESISYIRQKNADSTDLTDTVVTTIYENTSMRQKESLQEIPEEDLEEIRTEESKTIYPNGSFSKDEYFDSKTHLEQTNTNDRLQNTIKSYYVKKTSDAKKVNISELFNNKLRIEKRVQTAVQQQRKSFDDKSREEILRSNPIFRVKSDVSKRKEPKSQKIIIKKKADKEKTTLVPNSKGRMQNKNIVNQKLVRVNNREL